MRGGYPTHARYCCAWMGHRVWWGGGLAKSKNNGKDKSRSFPPSPPQRRRPVAGDPGLKNAYGQDDGCGGYGRDDRCWWGCEGELSQVSKSRPGAPGLVVVREKSNGNGDRGSLGFACLLSRHQAVRVWVTRSWIFWLTSLTLMKKGVLRHWRLSCWDSGA